ncbi:MAG: response regulator [Pirellulaceae bacterium]
MLVLNRKAEQKVSFPGLGITVQILRVQGSSVRLGIEAPMEVRVIRDELKAEDFGESHLQQTRVIRLPAKLRHEFRNQLNALSIGLYLFKEEVDAGQHEDAEETFEQLVAHLEHICDNPSLSPPDDSESKVVEATALLVEDEPNEREMLAGFLRMHGYTVATAADGLEAIEYLESHEPPSVVLIDMRMPRLDGPATIRRIRENPYLKDIRIFAISGSHPDEKSLQSTGESVNGWFHKPLNPKSLVDALAVIARDEKATAIC